MPKAEILIEHKLGVHARVAFALAERGRKFDSEISISFNGEKVNGKEVLEILSLAACSGGLLEVETVGPDEDEALESIRKFMEDGDGS